MKTNFPEVPNIEYPNLLILTIYTSPEHFSFSLYNPEQTGSYFYKELTVDNQSGAFTGFKEVFFDQSFFSLPFRKVCIMNRTSGFAFVPNSIYKNENKEDFMRFLFSERQGITMTGSVPSAGITVLYQLPEDVYRFMLRSFSKPEFIHYSTPIISYFLKESKNVDVSQMVVNLQKNGLDIFCFSRDTFVMGNYFPCKNLSDALYYILFTWKQLQLNQLDDYLHIIGDIVFKEKLIDKLSLYLQQIYFPVISSEIYFNSVDTERIPFELTALSVCEL